VQLPTSHPPTYPRMAWQIARPFCFLIDCWQF
jgi:hypothetical protein